MSRALAVVTELAVMSKTSVVVAEEERVSRLPSKVRFASPFRAEALEAVTSLLSTPFAKEVPPAAVKVTSSPLASVVMVILLPATKVSPSVALSATTSLCPDTDIVLKMSPLAPPLLPPL